MDKYFCSSIKNRHLIEEFGGIGGKCIFSENNYELNN